MLIIWPWNQQYKVASIFYFLVNHSKCIHSYLSINMDSILVAVRLHHSSSHSWLRQCVGILTDSTEDGQIQCNQCEERGTCSGFYRARPPGPAPLHLPSSLAHSAAERASWKGSINLALCGGSRAPLSSDPQTNLVINMAAAVRTHDYTMATHWHNSLIGVAE